MDEKAATFRAFPWSCQDRLSMTPTWMRRQQQDISCGILELCPSFNDSNMDEKAAYRFFAIVWLL
jgi:hypothetical protein